MFAEEEPVNFLVMFKLGLLSGGFICFGFFSEPPVSFIIILPTVDLEAFNAGGIFFSNTGFQFRALKAWEQKPLTSTWLPYTVTIESSKLSSI